MSFIYKYIIKRIGKKVPPKFQPLWKHPAGPQTIFFWAPLMKWVNLNIILFNLLFFQQFFNFQSLVIAGLGDLRRPASKLSATQSASLAATGFVWSRYSLVIIPKNWSLFLVNFFVGMTGLYQLMKYYRYHISLKKMKSH